MSEEQDLLQCYNRGCGEKYSPKENRDDSCCHHPGTPIFHDAYKGWSCCNKKSTDFTEFLNFKGCTKSKHSSVKPPEPERPKQQISDEEIASFQPVNEVRLTRPPIDAPFTTLKPHIASSLADRAKAVRVEKEVASDDIPIGTACKHSGCNATYDGKPDSPAAKCVYHPGVPIFHEGLKFWSCCQKRTTDFNAFLSQVGCEEGQHVWRADEDSAAKAQCRWDYHQTGSHVILSIYAKDYCPNSSVIKLNPVRLHLKLVFPEKDNAAFEMDCELFEIVDVVSSESTMYGSKVEVKLKKARPCHWTKFEIRRINEGSKEPPKLEKTAIQERNTIKDVDLSDL